MGRALIVIGVQNEYFIGKLPVSYPPESFENILKAMDVAAAKEIPVIVVRLAADDVNSTVFKKDSLTWELHKEIAKRPCDLLVDTNFPGSFNGTIMDSWMRKRNIDTVVISGYTTHVCCDSMARQAFHMGFSVEFLSDATGTLYFKSNQRSVTAEELYRVTLVTQEWFSRILKTSEWIEALKC